MREMGRYNKLVPILLVWDTLLWDHMLLFSCLTHKYGIVDLSVMHVHVHVCVFLSMGLGS